MSDFKGRHFGGEIVLWAVRWYCRYPISYRDLESMMTERGVSVDHSTIDRWVQHFAPEMERRLRWQWRWPRSRSWRIDETYVKVRGKQTRGAFVHVGERLQVRYMHHRKEGLLEGIGHLADLLQQDVQHLVDRCGNGQRTIDAPGDIDRVPAQPAFVGGVGKQVLRKRAMQVEQRMAIELDGARVVDQQLDGALVIQDHLRFDGGSPPGHLAVPDKLEGVETGVGVAFESARSPRQIDQHPVQDGSPRAITPRRA